MKKKSIAVLTFHSARNYGAVLQTYSLVNFLKSHEYAVKVIDFRPSGVTGRITMNPTSWLAAIHFNGFEKNFLNISGKVYRNNEDLLSSPPDADIYIVGSDQVWNPDITNQNIFSYYFDFVSSGKKMISYAASFGNSCLNLSDKDVVIVETLLKKFSYISVRESHGVEILKNKFNIESNLVVDPTLLYSDFSDLYLKKFISDGLVAFKFNKCNQFYDLLRYVGNKLHLPIKILDSARLKKGMHVIPKPSINLWISTIKESSFVITDSYHGMIFSILFGKQFIVIPADIKRFSRIECLLSEIGLSDRIYYSYDEVYKNNNWMSPINYDKVMLRLNEMRYKSQSFLLNSI